MSTTRIAVAGETSYDVVVGRGLDAELVPLLGSRRARVALVHPETRPDDAARLASVVADAGLAAAAPARAGRRGRQDRRGRRRLLGRARARRVHPHATPSSASAAVPPPTSPASSPRPGCAGCASCTCPRPLLGMVDAAVGGKTGINTAEGKNLVGAFHAPAGVLCDLDALADAAARSTWPPGSPRWSRSGSSPTPSSSTSSRPTRVAARDVRGEVLRELVERAVRVKAAVVSDDLRESRPGGLGREMLNYGHTLRPRDRAGRALPLAARRTRCRSAWCSSPRWPGSPGGSTRTTRRVTARCSGPWGCRRPTRGTVPGSCSRRCGSTRRRGATSCGSSSSTASASPGLLEGPDPALLQAAYDEVSEVAS